MDSKQSSTLYTVFHYVTIGMGIIGIGFVLLGILYFLSQKPTPQKTAVSPTSTVSPTPTVLGTPSTSARCHAINVNPSDPQAFLPDPNCTPGTIDPSVTQDNLFTTICHAGYTQTVRPPVSYTNTLKKQQIADYGYQDTSMKDYEEDHFISLELGGNPTDPKNLWPEPHPSTNEKDTVENYLHSQVCSGKLTLAKAQQEISQNWYTVYLQIK
ncbi:MAG: hypothetical protein ABSD69_03090 [Candidatus Levyibacteriota bacterium]|jgi:hypothetical protein